MPQDSAQETTMHMKVVACIRKNKTNFSGMFIAHRRYHVEEVKGLTLFVFHFSLFLNLKVLWHLPKKHPLFQEYRSFSKRSIWNS